MSVTEYSGSDDDSDKTMSPILYRESDFPSIKKSLGVDESLVEFSSVDELLEHNTNKLHGNTEQRRLPQTCGPSSTSARASVPCDEQTLKFQATNIVGKLPLQLTMWTLMSTLTKSELIVLCKYCGVQSRWDNKKEEMGKIVLNRLHKGAFDALRAECAARREIPVLEKGSGLRVQSQAVDRVKAKEPREKEKEVGIVTKQCTGSSTSLQLPISLLRIRSSDWRECDTPGGQTQSMSRNPLEAVQVKDGLFINPHAWRPGTADDEEALTLTATSDCNASQQQQQQQARRLLRHFNECSHDIARFYLDTGIGAPAKDQRKSLREQAGNDGSDRREDGYGKDGSDRREDGYQAEKDGSDRREDGYQAEKDGDKREAINHLQENNDDTDTYPQTQSQSQEQDSDHDVDSTSRRPTIPTTATDRSSSPPPQRGQRMTRVIDSQRRQRMTRVIDSLRGSVLPGWCPRPPTIDAHTQTTFTGTTGMMISSVLRTPATSLSDRGGGGGGGGSDRGGGGRGGGGGGGRDANAVILVSFESRKLGIKIGQRTIARSSVDLGDGYMQVAVLGEVPEGLTNYLSIGDEVAYIEGKDVKQMSYSCIIDYIRISSRPLVLGFKRPTL